jgi:hypothetical protein
LANHRVQPECFRLLTPLEDLARYTLFTRTALDYFCPTCGIHPLAEAQDRTGRPMAAINVRCLEGIDLESLQVRHFDGAAL